MLFNTENILVIGRLCFVHSEFKIQNSCQTQRFEGQYCCHQMETLIYLFEQLVRSHHTTLCHHPEYYHARNMDVVQ
jgi:hypothetical protein